MNSAIRSSIESKRFFRDLQLFLVYLFLFSQLFFLVSFSKINTSSSTITFSLTFPFLVSIIYFIFSFIGVLVGEIIVKKQNLLYGIIFSIILFICMIFSKYYMNIKSFCLAVYYISLFVMLDYRHESKNSLKVIESFVIMSTIFNLYGVYQFFAYNVFPQLPFKELIPQKIWTSNYNVIQYIKGDNFVGMVKPHSIYVEATVLSRLSAINILLIYSLRKKFNILSIFIMILINLSSLILSLSGSGIIILIVGLLYIIYKADYRYKFIIISIILSLIIIIYNYKDNDYIAYFLGRTSELDTNNNTNSSGYYRFILPIKIGIDNLIHNFFGYGIGNDDIAYSLYNAKESAITNGFGKIFVECGFLGLCSLIYLFKLLKPNKNKKDIEVFFILYLILIICNIVGSFMEINFWCYALFLAVSKE